jgi:glycosyltransferase involved in cell wall biosynthesis
LNRPAVSVVIPVYKVEAYLERCVRSVRDQSLKDLEIILVDDGSPDRSPEMCDAFAAEDDRIRVIHKENGGLASARNAGMHMARGEYLFFLDSDDWLEEEGLERLCRTADKYGVDFVRYRAWRTGWPGCEENIPCRVEDVRELEGGLYDRERIVREVYPRLLATPQLTLGAVVGAWGSLYRLDFLKAHNILFDEKIRFSEDILFSARVVRKAESFYFIDEPGVYHYFYNKTSISKSFRRDRWDSCRALMELAEKYFSHDPDYDFSSQINILKWHCVFLSLNEYRFLKERSDRVSYCAGIMKDPALRRLKLALSLMEVPFRQKVLMVLIKMGMAGLYVRLTEH